MATIGQGMNMLLGNFLWSMRNGAVSTGSASNTADGVLKIDALSAYSVVNDGSRFIRGASSFAAPAPTVRPE